MQLLPTLRGDNSNLKNLAKADPVGNPMLPHMLLPNLLYAIIAASETIYLPIVLIQKYQRTTKTVEFPLSLQPKADLLPLLYLLQLTPLL